MEKLINEMERRFGDDNTMPLLTSINACRQHANNFLGMEVLHPLVQA
jgi:hypothetical protein